MQSLGSYIRYLFVFVVVLHVHLVGCFVVVSVCHCDLLSCWFLLLYVSVVFVGFYLTLSPLTGTLPDER